MTGSVLVVDDERMIRDSVSSFLRQKGLPVFSAESGNEALAIFEAEPISFVILDLMLPDLSGEEVCAAIRRTSRVPIIMLTAKTMEEDRISGLNLGADDYVTKPFSLKELYARMEAVSRRVSEGAFAPVHSWNRGDLVVDIANRTVRKAGAEVVLTSIEWKILSALIRRPGKIFTRDELLDIAFQQDFDGYDRVVDTHIKNLRKKIETDSKQPVYLLTVHGVGYRFGGA